MSNHIARYQEQSKITRIHRYKTELDCLPNTVIELIDMLNGLIIHYIDGDGLPDTKTVALRKHELDSRFVSTMLQRIFRLDPSPLNQAQPVSRRLLCMCRDAAVLLCSLMRHKGIPSRVRFGFTHSWYQRASLLHDHAVVEYWNGSEWRLAESLMLYIQSSDIPFAADNLPPELFIPGSEAWRQVVSGEQRAQAFSSYKHGKLHSESHVRSILLYDLASLAGYEPLLWDQWGRHYDFSRPTLPFKDDVLNGLFECAVATNYQNESQCQQVIDMFNDITGIVNDTEIHSFSPMVGLYTVTGGAEASRCFSR